MTKRLSVRDSRGPEAKSSTLRSVSMWSTGEEPVSLRLPICFELCDENVPETPREVIVKAFSSLSRAQQAEVLTIEEPKLCEQLGREFKEAFHFEWTATRVSGRSLGKLRSELFASFEHEQTVSMGSFGVNNAPWVKISPKKSLSLTGDAMGLLLRLSPDFLNSYRRMKIRFAPKPAEWIRFCKDLGGKKEVDCAFLQCLEFKILTEFFSGGKGSRPFDRVRTLLPRDGGELNGKGILGFFPSTPVDEEALIAELNGDLAKPALTKKSKKRKNRNKISTKKDALTDNEENEESDIALQESVQKLSPLSASTCSHEQYIFLKKFKNIDIPVINTFVHFAQSLHLRQRSISN